MWETISAILIKYWVEFLLGLIVAGGGFFLKRYIRLERLEREHSQDEHFKKLTDKIQEENKIMIESLVQEHDEINKRSDKRYNEITSKVAEAMIVGREESKADDAALQNQIHTLSNEMDCLKAGLLSMQGKEFREGCRKLLADDHEITLDEWEEIDADHEAYNGLGGNHRGDHLFELVKKKVEKTLTDVN